MVFPSLAHPEIIISLAALLILVCRIRTASLIDSRAGKRRCFGSQLFLGQSQAAHTVIMQANRR